MMCIDVIPIVVYGVGILMGVGFLVLFEWLGS